MTVTHNNGNNAHTGDPVANFTVNVTSASLTQSFTDASRSRLMVLGLSGGGTSQNPDPPRTTPGPAPSPDRNRG